MERSNFWPPHTDNKTPSPGPTQTDGAAAYLDDSEGDGDAGDVHQVGCELVLQ